MASEHIEQGAVTRVLLVGHAWLRHDDRGIGGKHRRNGGGDRKAPRRSPGDPIDVSGCPDLPGAAVSRPAPIRWWTLASHPRSLGAVPTRRTTDHARHSDHGLADLAIP